MNELSVRFNSEQQNDSSQITVSLFRPEAGAMTTPVPFSPPLGDAELAELHWYLEVYSTWPTGPDYERAERIEANLEDWGRALFSSICDGTDSARLWQQFLDHDDGNKLLTIDAEDPRVLRLPWEILADEGGHFFSAEISVRRRLQQATTSSKINPFALPLRVLVLVSRPAGFGFIDPRSISEPLLETLEQIGAGAQVECLYPPTLKALSDRLHDKKLPPVHVLHFDGHGVYDKHLGLGYLLFENEKHESDRVDANRLGTLLNRCGVPLMVLNACQSAKQEDANPYASVAARLIRAGVGSVLAMNYPVLVTAARKFTAAFYGGLIEGSTVGQAVDRARYALLSDEERHSITRRNNAGEHIEETIRLRDWFLPALYQQAQDPIVFASPSLEEKRGGQGVSSPEDGGQGLSSTPRAIYDPTFPGGLPEAPPHGFHGRAREMLKLERALAEQEIVVLHGFGGIGKTSLAAEAGRWFYRTGRFPGGAAFVSFEHGGSLQQLCSWVGQAISNDPNFMLGEGDPVQRIGQLLQERPALLILDNFESVLGRDPLMPPEELQALLDAVWSWTTLTPGPSPRWRGEHRAGSKILITTRDTSFNDKRFGPSKRCRQIPLGGLAPQEALELAAAVLEDCGIERERITRQDLLDLMERLGGHPLSLSLVLPHLAQNSPQELSQRFEELLPGFSSGAAKERNESLQVSLDFSLRRLGEETRAALPALAVFEGGASEDDMLAITQIDPELWKTARSELEQAALLTTESIPGVTAPFLQFHPTLLPYLATLLDATQRRELEERYRERYYQVSLYLYKSDIQHPHQARAIALWELPNLKRAFALSVAAAQLPSPSGRGAGGEGIGAGGEGDMAYQAIDFADNIARFLDVFGCRRERDALLAQVADLQLSGAGGITKAEFLRLDRQGDILLQQGRAAQAQALFEELLQRLEAGAAYDAAYDRAMTFFSLGRCLAAQGQAEAAIQRHQQALQAFERLSESSDSAKKMWGKTHGEIADNLQRMGRFDEAEKAYKEDLRIAKEVDDHREVGVALGQLGSLAMQRGDLQEAASRYRDALQTFRALGESQSEAVAWHQLGMVAQKAKEWEEAERCYREAVRIREQIRDLPGVAQGCNQLALVAQGAGRPDDAERWYLRAIEVDEQLGNPKELAPDYSNLANLYRAQGRLEEAERYARRAVDIVEKLDLSAEPWNKYGILADILSARGRGDEAAEWRRKEQDSFAAYAGAAYQLPRWAPEFIRAVVAAKQGDKDAREQVQNMCSQMAETDYRTLPPVIERILNDETDFELLRMGLDRMDAYIIRIILSGGETPQPAASSQPPEQQEQEEGMSLEKFLELVGLACRPEAPAGLAEQLHGATRAMAQDPDAPAEMRALGQVLNQILSGEREPDLSLLPQSLANAVHALLAGL